MDSERILVKDNVVLVRWRQMTVDGIQRAIDVVADTAAAVGPVTYVGLVGNEATLPSEAVRTALLDAIDTMLPNCSSMNLAFDGTGLKFVAIRSAAAAMFLIKGDRRMAMYSSLDEALIDRAPGKATGLTVAARDRGLIA